jgi:Double-GTPase 1
LVAAQHTILLVGESNVGKTHYGAQFLKRLMVKACALKMSGAPTNLEAFTTALSCLTEGRSTDHTPANTYVESVWPITDEAGRYAELVWPDYGGEQVRNLVTQRRIPAAWRERVLESTDWVLLIRLHSLRSEDDLFSRPLQSFAAAEPQGDEVAYELTDQARTVELLQMLLYLAQFHLDRPLRKPRLTILLSCWDELETSELPAELLASQLPMLWSFLRSNWTSPTVIGLSALERALSKTDADQEYAIRGPEEFGYVVLPNGVKNTDITLPIQRLMADGI